MTKISPLQHLQVDDLLATIPSGLFVVGLDQTVLAWNKAAEDITGFTADDVVGQHCSILQGIPCGESCGLLDESTPKPIIGARCTIVAKDGRSISLLKNVEFLRDAAGQIIGGIESFTDITRQKELEADLREQAASLEKRVEVRTAELARSEARFRAVLDTMDDLAYIADESYTITFMNRAMRKHFGHLLDKPCHLALHELETVCPWCPMERVLSNRTVRDERQFGPLQRTFEIIHSPLISEDGTRQKLAVCRDITERKQTEQELREANRELDAFAHSISHDLRGILAPVVTYMDFLSEQYGDVLEEQVLQVLSEVERQSERAISLLDDLLDLAQVGQIEPSGRPTDVTQIIREVLEEHQAEADHPELKVKLKELPSTWVPETLIYQCFANLIGNALNYAGNNGGPIEIGCWQEPHQRTYYVRDHGPGVPNSEREKIFEIFSRGKSAKGTRGTGVGLAIVRKVALRCQGSSWVEDTPGGGATFCIAFPSQPQRPPSKS